MNYKKTIIGSSLAFLIATSCCWLPGLLIAIGGGSTFIGISNGLESVSGIFMIIGVGLLVFGIYQYKKKKEMAVKKRSDFTINFNLSRMWSYERRNHANQCL